jgi:hypothetical protein
LCLRLPLSARRLRGARTVSGDRCCTRERTAASTPPLLPFIWCCTYCCRCAAADDRCPLSMSRTGVVDNDLLPPRYCCSSRAVCVRDRSDKTVNALMSALVTGTYSGGEWHSCNRLRPSVRDTDTRNVLPPPPTAMSHTVSARMCTHTHPCPALHHRRCYFQRPSTRRYFPKRAFLHNLMSTSTTCVTHLSLLHCHYRRLLSPCAGQVAPVAHIHSQLSQPCYYHCALEAWRR